MRWLFVGEALCYEKRNVSPCVYSVIAPTLAVHSCQFVKFVVYFFEYFVVKFPSSSPFSVFRGSVYDRIRAVKGNNMKKQIGMWSFLILVSL